MAWQGKGSTRAWRVTRAAVLERDAYACQLKGPKCTGTATTVHHRLPWSGNPAAVPLDQLEAACEPCNLELGEPVPDPPFTAGPTAW